MTRQNIRNRRSAANPFTDLIIHWPQVRSLPGPRLSSLSGAPFRASQSPRAPCGRALIPDLLLSAGRRERPGLPGCRQGTRADCAARWGELAPTVRGGEPAQSSQSSPRPPAAPRALGQASAISRRCRRHAIASNVIAPPWSVFSSHWIVRNCGSGFIGSSHCWHPPSAAWSGGRAPAPAASRHERERGRVDRQFDLHACSSYWLEEPKLPSVEHRLTWR